ncbi:MAG: PspC domain-containing protein [Saprospiraceae bacterium]|nr:PspC domain-containing protein [Saprospiraceae bacterium]
MNKIQYINVGGYPFSINEDAFHKLDNYLSRLDRHFSRSEGHKEIMQDIESRIAELFHEYLAGQKILNIEHVDKMIAVMGTAENMADTTDNNEVPPGDASWNYYTGKRLFKDPYDKKIAGVCSGIAHYFGIEDPTWVRVAFVFFGFWGFGIILYLIMMFVLPEAISPSDRLSMKGKPINIQNIADKVEEEFDDITNRFDDWRSKWKNKKQKRWHKRY